MIARKLLALLCAFGWGASVRAQAIDDDPYAAQATLRVATPAQVGERLEAWLKSAPAEIQIGAVRQRFSAASSLAPLDRLAESLAAGNPQAAAIVAAARAAQSPDEATSQWLTAQTGLLGETLRLYLGRGLAQRGRYDAALPWLTQVPPENAIDPAQALFYRAACLQAQLNREECLDTLAQLLEVEPLPARYRVMARQMQSEMRGLEAESLDFVSRQMRDVERRLNRGDADQPLRQVQDDVLAALDKLIKEEEEKQNQSGGGGGGGSGIAQGGATQPAQPAQESRLLGGKGPGRVAPKAINREGGWGALPPKEREEAWQQLGREFPSHYRDVVEQYFRELAREEESAGSP